MNGLGMLADGIEIAAKKAPAFTDILTRYWWISVPTLFIIYKRWQHNRKHLEFEEALMQTVLDTSPVVSSAIALGFLVAQTRGQSSPLPNPPSGQRPKPPQQERVIDVTSYSVEQPQSQSDAQSTKRSRSP